MEWFLGKRLSRAIEGAQAALSGVIEKARGLGDVARCAVNNSFPIARPKRLLVMGENRFYSPVIIVEARATMETTWLGRSVRRLGRIAIGFVAFVAGFAAFAVLTMINLRLTDEWFWKLRRHWPGDCRYGVRAL